MWKHRSKIGLVLSLLAFAAMMALVAFLVPAQGAVSQPADPPECTLIVIHNLGGATGERGELHVNFCGAGSEGLSPLRPKSPAWGPFLVDGASLTPADCTQAAPCSVFAEGAPQTGR